MRSRFHNLPFVIIIIQFSCTHLHVYSIEAFTVTITTDTHTGEYNEKNATGKLVENLLIGKLTFLW